MADHTDDLIRVAQELIDSQKQIIAKQDMLIAIFRNALTAQQAVSEQQRKELESLRSQLGTRHRRMEAQA